MEDQISLSKQNHALYNNKSYWLGAFDPSHPDTARHYEMLNNGLKLIKHINPRTLLSIGDNLARDAGFFKAAIPNCRCIASDLSTSGIRKAATDGFVDEVHDVDVENIPYANNSIDIVIAKEAFHHWPRPMLGFYEMLRVAKHAIVLIEPNDILYGEFGNSLPIPSSYNDDYEEVGNYKYQLSLREILKSAWALSLPVCAVVGFNDPYKVPFDINAWHDEKLILDEMGRSGTRAFNLLSIAVYKQEFDVSLISSDPDINIYKRPRSPWPAGTTS